MTPLGSPVVPLENGSATSVARGSISTPGAGVPGGASSSSNGVVPAASPIENTSSTPAALRRLERALGQLRRGHEKARARDAQLERRLLGGVEPVDGRVRPAGPRNAVKRDGVLGHVGREDADALAGLEPTRSEPGRAAIDVLGQLGVRQRGAADRIHDRHALTARRGAAEHEVGQRRRRARARPDAGCGSPLAGMTLRVDQMAPRRVLIATLSLSERGKASRLSCEGGRDSCSLHTPQATHAQLSENVLPLGRPSAAMIRA